MNDVRNEFEILIDKLKKIKPMETKKKLPRWIVDCSCGGCKRLRKLLGIENEKEEEKKEDE